MEPNFSLKATRPMVAFWGAISDERLSNVFRFEDQDFLNRGKIVLGDEYMRGEFKYRTNVDMASMFTAAWENAEIRLELEKWSPSLGRRLGGDSSLGSSPKKKRGRPRGSKNIMGGRSMWIGFPAEAHDDHVDEENRRERAMEGCEKGKEIVVVNVPQ
ncbi:hypothetical protein SUGI_0603540 [Cryptomeria japonica]|nr:hypothetical protein SUGI_0603540 [Cryptomeria japonica]